MRGQGLAHWHLDPVPHWPFVSAVKSAWFKLLTSCKRSIFAPVRFNGGKAQELSLTEVVIRESVLDNLIEPARNASWRVFLPQQLLAVSRKEGRCTPVGVLSDLIELARTASQRVVPLNHSTFATQQTPKRGRLRPFNRKLLLHHPY